MHHLPRWTTYRVPLLGSTTVEHNPLAILVCTRSPREYQTDAAQSMSASQARTVERALLSSICMQISRVLCEQLRFCEAFLKSNSKRRKAPTRRPFVLPPSEQLLFDEEDLLSAHQNTIAHACGSHRHRTKVCVAEAVTARRHRSSSPRFL